MKSINIVDLDKTLTNHKTSAYNWLVAQSSSIPEQRKIASTDEFKRKQTMEEVAPWILPFATNYQGESYLDPVATLIPTGRWTDALEITEEWLSFKHHSLRHMIGLHVEIVPLNYEDYNKYLNDKFSTIKSWISRIFAYKKLFAQKVQVNVYDDAFDVVKTISKWHLSYVEKLACIWVHDGVPKELKPFTNPDIEGNWTRMI